MSLSPGSRLGSYEIAASLAVRIAPATSFSASPPQKLFDDHYYSKGATHIGYDVSRDGQRFLMGKEVTNPQSRTSPSLIVVPNWVEELKARLASK